MMFGLMVLGLLAGCDRTPATSSQPASVPASAPASAAAGDTAAERQLRVLLLNEVRTAAIVPADSFRILDARSREVLRPDEPPRGLAIQFTDRAMNMPGLGWQTDRPAVDVVPSGDRPIRVKCTDDWKEFRGAIRLVRRPEGGAVINLIDVEDYLVGVVSSELPAGFQRETFRVQAIACRTYAWYLRQTSGRKREWDLTATEKSQVYRGLDRVVPRATEAVHDTRGIVCTWMSPQGEKIF